MPGIQKKLESEIYNNFLIWLNTNKNQALKLSNTLIERSLLRTDLSKIKELERKSIKAKNILEIGMFTGYSAMTMAESLPKGGIIHTCELMEEHVKTAKGFFSKSKHGNKIKIHQGSALDTLETFKVNSFDLAFIDADKINYLNYYKYCVQLVKQGGIIILDNMLWGGSVINPKEDDAKKIRETGDFIQEDPRVENSLFPIRDGIMVCIKK